MINVVPCGEEYNVPKNVVPSGGEYNVQNVYH